MNPMSTNPFDEPPSAGGAQRDVADAKLSRRRLIQSVGVAGGAALTGASALMPELATALQDATPVAAEGAEGLPPDVPPWMKEWGPLLLATG